MTFQIRKRFEFSASHVLLGLAPGHPCGRLHGHNYAVEAVLAGEPDGRGFVFDYRDLDPFKAYIDDQLDHRHINDAALMRGRQPSAENMASALFDVLETMLRDLPGYRLTDGPGFRVAEVRVSETPKTWAEYRP